MIQIFEPIYHKNQHLVESNFQPLKLKNNNFPSWREFRILVEFYRKKQHLDAQKSGIFSPKFQLKTHITGNDFIAFCESHAAADVCFINPFPQWRYFTYNVWMQGESYHPGLISNAQNLLSAAKIPWTLDAVGRHDAANMAYSNFWVATPDFWDRYVGGVLLPIADFLENNATHPAAVAVMTTTYHSDPAPFLPFIIERLFSTFLSFNPDIKVAAYAFKNVEAHCLNDIQKAMVTCMQPFIDAADSTGAAAFDIKLVNHLQHVCNREAELTKSHFAVHPFPHTGRTIPQA